MLRLPPAAAEQLGCDVGAIANSVVFECDGRYAGLGDATVV
jgi:prolyl-tRNA editing enzyme YbaK/EbsC (Cys-tRNA(Pro) deacylase)